MDRYDQGAITLGEEELRFLNLLSGLVPSMPDFQRVLRRVVVEVAKIVPLDAFAMAVCGERGVDMTICAVRSVGETFLNSVREDMLATCRNLFPDVTTVGVDVDMLVLSVDDGSAASSRVGSAEFHRFESLAQGFSGMFRADASDFDPKDFFLFTLLSNWLASYHVLSGAYRRMEELSVTDPLTGVCNRRKFIDELEKEAERVRRYRFDLSVILIDLDRLKEINDTHGHLVGDAVLRQVVGAVLQSTRKVDLLARQGGDEFALLLPHTARTGALAVAERIVARCRESETRFEDRVVRFSVSAGVAAIVPGEASDAFLRRADGALYEAKRKGRDRAEAAD